MVLLKVSTSSLKPCSLLEQQEHEHSYALSTSIYFVHAPNRVHSGLPGGLSTRALSLPPSTLARPKVSNFSTELYPSRKVLDSGVRIVSKTPGHFIISICSTSILTSGEKPCHRKCGNYSVGCSRVPRELKQSRGHGIPEKISVLQTRAYREAVASCLSGAITMFAFAISVCSDCCRRRGRVPYQHTCVVLIL